MNTKEKTIQDSSYESPMIKLVEFEVEVGFAASEANEIPAAGFSGTIQGTDNTHTY